MSATDCGASLSAKRAHVDVDAHESAAARYIVSSICVKLALIKKMYGKDSINHLLVPSYAYPARSIEVKQINAAGPLIRAILPSTVVPA